MVTPERQKREDAEARFAECQKDLENSGKQLEMGLGRMGASVKEIANTGAKTTTLPAREKKEQRDNYNPEKYDAQMKSIESKMRMSNPGGIILDYVNQTIELYTVCCTAAVCALDKYGVSTSEPKEIADCLKETFVKKHLLDEKYEKTMRTMYTLSTLISKRKIKEMDAGSYAKYYTETAEFVEAMERIVGYTKKQQRTSQDKAQRSDAKQCYQRGIVENVIDYVGLSVKELAKIGIFEVSYFYLKNLVFASPLIGLALLGKCAYIDAEIAQHDQTTSAYTTNIGEQIQKKTNEMVRGCGIQR